MLHRGRHNCWQANLKEEPDFSRRPALGHSPAPMSIQTTMLKLKRFFCGEPVQAITCTQAFTQALELPGSWRSSYSCLVTNSFSCSHLPSDAISEDRLGNSSYLEPGEPENFSTGINSKQKASHSWAWADVCVKIPTSGSWVTEPGDSGGK